MEIFEQLPILFKASPVVAVFYVALQFYKQWNEQRNTSQNQKQTAVDNIVAHLETRIKNLNERLEAALSDARRCEDEKDVQQRQFYDEQNKNLDVIRQKDFELRTFQQTAEHAKDLLNEADKRIAFELEQRDATIKNLREASVQVAENVPVIVWLARSDGTLDYYNRRWYEYSGQTVAESFGWGWEPVLHPDDLAHCKEKWTQAFHSGQDYEVFYRFKRARDGAFRWHLGRATALKDEQGRVLRWFGVCVDVHDFYKP